jgi:hypothetical protein
VNEWHLRNVQQLLFGVVVERHAFCPRFNRRVTGFVEDFVGSGGSAHGVFLACRWLRQMRCKGCASVAWWVLGDFYVIDIKWLMSDFA